MDFAALLATEEARIAGAFGGIFAMTGILFIVIALIQRRRMGRVKRLYQSTSGRVLNAQVETRGDSEGSAYYPVVEYEYTVNGQRYQSSKLALGSEIGRGNLSAVERRVTRYIVGQLVQVYYNPNKPILSVLELQIAFKQSGSVFRAVLHRDWRGGRGYGVCSESIDGHINDHDWRIMIVSQPIEARRTSFVYWIGLFVVVTLVFLLFLPKLHNFSGATLPEMVYGTADKPFAYRVLVPFTVRVLTPG